MGDYHIWSVEHSAWWRGSHGYTQRLSEAGIFSRDVALRRCFEAMPGNAARYGVLPDLPVAAADVGHMRDVYAQRFPDLPAEDWQ